MSIQFTYTWTYDYAFSFEDLSCSSLKTIVECWVHKTFCEWRAVKIPQSNRSWLILVCSVQIHFIIVIFETTEITLERQSVAKHKE